jgi:hypothetical protein
VTVNSVDLEMNAMKSMNKILILIMALATAVIFTQCSDDVSGGAPRVRYVRITEPTSADSLLVAAAQGQMVAIMGENLQNVVEVWFNDQPAQLQTTFITSTSIITRIPAELPEVITNKMTLVFANGQTLEYDFSVDISEPLVTRMKSEYVNTGDVATFYGDFFYEPLVVTFSGGVEAEIVEVEDRVLSVIVPDGAEPGPVTIASNFGITETDFWFRDNRNIIASFDVPLVNGVWQGPTRIVSSDPDITPVNNKFIRVNAELGPWPFYEMYGGPKEGDIGIEAKSIPQGAIISPGDYSLKFEIITLKSMAGATMRLHIGNADNSGLDAARQSSFYAWEVNLDTGGEWQTVTLPWADVYQGFEYDPEGYSVFIYFHGPNAASHNFGLDNIRVVPNTND